MSIRERVEDAEVLWREGRKEGAWVLALVAAAATARKRYPTPISDGQSFRSFIRNVTPILLYGDASNQDFEGDLRLGATPLVDIFYDHLRCHLVHEGAKSGHVEFSESKIVDGRTESVLGVGDPKLIPEIWVLHLLMAVRTARENAHLFKSPT